MITYSCEVCENEFELSPHTFVGLLSGYSTCHASLNFNQLCEHCYKLSVNSSAFLFNAQNIESSCNQS
mgnify:CR=1 FL=1